MTKILDGSSHFQNDIYPELKALIDAGSHSIVAK